LIKADWDPDEYPRWPAGSADSVGGQFAPKGEGGDADASNTPLSDAVYRTTADSADSFVAADRNSDWQTLRTELTYHPTSDSAATDTFDGTHESFDSGDTPRKILVAAEEDERDPRIGIGGNHPPPEQLIPKILQQSPAGPIVQFFDNLLDISGPGDEANLEWAELQERNLLRGIRQVDQNFSYASASDGLADMSWQERREVIDGLKADLAAAIYNKRGDIRSLQEVTLDFMQRSANTAYDEAVQLYDAGELNVQLSAVATSGYRYLCG
jgi:hypothetical protein